MKYKVGLTVDVYMSADVEVEATSREEAEAMALEQAKDAGFKWRDDGINPEAIEVTGTEEVAEVVWAASHASAPGRVRLGTPDVLAMTDDDWQLYTVAMDCTEAANAINTAIDAAYKGGKDRHQTLCVALMAMGKYRDLGAMDSEPLNVLEDVLDKLYGRKD